MHPTESALHSRKTLAEELEVVQLRLEQLERTVAALTHESTDFRLAGPCTRCDRSLLVVRDGTLTCPLCQYQRSL